MGGERTLRDDEIDAALLLYPDVSSPAMLRAALLEIKLSRALERRYGSDAQVARLRGVDRLMAIGLRSTQVSLAGSLVSAHDYENALAELLPYRAELLRLAEEFGEGGDPFALWEHLREPTP